MKNRLFRNKPFFLFVFIFLLPGKSITQPPQNNHSVFGGVQLGTITYSYRSMPDQTLPAILSYIVESGLNSVELMGPPVERFAGIPAGSDAQAIRQWRLTVPMTEFEEVRQMFDEKGVKIDILKLGHLSWSDEEFDYAFRVCKVLGARGISLEISEEAARRLAPLAEEHGLMVVLHNHGQPADPDFSFDRILAYGPNVMLNLDVGHYFGYTGRHPNTVIERLHERIASIHLKDKTGPDAIEPNRNKPFGEGETPIRDILLLIKENNWPITVDIELEYPIPDYSDAVRETRRCLLYCKDILLWEDLFNGQDLTGWVQRGGADLFEAVDNMIVGTAVSGTPNSFLCTEEVYGDFILELEFKIDLQLNSGVQIRSLSLPEYRDGKVHGYQVDIVRGGMAALFDEHRRGWLYQLIGEEHEEARNAFRENEWNSMRIEAIGYHIKTWLNDIPVVNLIDDMTPEGFIALQVHVSNPEGSQVWFRNIRIMTEDLDRFSWASTAPEKSLINIDH